MACPYASYMCLLHCAGQQSGFNLLGGKLLLQTLKLPPQKFPQLQFKIMALRKLLPAGREGWLSVGVVAQWQSAGGSSQRPWVRSPAAPPFFLSLCHFKGLRTVTARLSLIRRSPSVFKLWGSSFHRTPHAVITLTIHYDHIICIYAQVIAYKFNFAMHTS